MFLLKEAYSKSKGGSTYSVTCADLRLACTFLGYQLLKYFFCYSFCLASISYYFCRSVVINVTAVYPSSQFIIYNHYFF